MAEKKTTRKKPAVNPADETIVKNPTKEAKVVEPNSLEFCAMYLANKGKIDKARRTAEGIKDPKVKEAVLAKIESIAKTI